MSRSCHGAVTRSRLALAGEPEELVRHAERMEEEKPRSVVDHTTRPPRATAPSSDPFGVGRLPVPAVEAGARAPRHVTRGSFRFAEPVFEQRHPLGHVALERGTILRCSARLRGRGPGRLVRYHRKVRSRLVSSLERQLVFAVAGSLPPAGLSRGDRTRTCNPRFWRPVLYQLSYAPRFEPCQCIPRPGRRLSGSRRADGGAVLGDHPCVRRDRGLDRSGRGVADRRLSAALAAWMGSLAWAALRKIRRNAYSQTLSAYSPPWQGRTRKRSGWNSRARRTRRSATG